MTKKNKKKPDPQDVINTAGSAGSGVPKEVIDAGTKPKQKKKPKNNMPEPPDTGIAGDTADIGKKEK